MERRNFCRSMAGIAVGAGGLAGSTLFPLHAQDSDEESLRANADKGIRDFTPFWQHRIAAPW